MGTPIITESHGTQSTTSSEATLFEIVTGTKYYETFINLKNMTASETFVIRTYIWDEQLGEYMSIDKQTKSNVQDPVAAMIDMRCGTRYKVTIQRTAGSDKTVTWIRFEV